jgi:hypothetical protein
MQIKETEERPLWHKPQILGLAISMDTGFTKGGSCEDLEQPTNGFERLKNGLCPAIPD